MDPLTKDINTLVEDHLPEFKWWGYNLLFTRVEDVFSAQWILDGQTPVPIAAVLDALVRKGVNLSSVEGRLDALSKEKEAASSKRLALQQSAKAKLTPDEIEACGL